MEQGMEFEQSMLDQYGMERYVKAMCELSTTYVRDGIPTTVEDMQKLLDRDPLAFKLFEHRLERMADEYLSQLQQTGVAHDCSPTSKSQ